MHARNYMFPLWFLALAFPSLGQTATVDQMSIPGIPPVSFPRFENNVSISETRSGNGAEAYTTLKVFDDPGSFVFRFTSTESYNVTNTGYLLSARYNAVGEFVDGSVSITGIVQGYPDHLRRSRTCILPTLLVTPPIQQTTQLRLPWVLRPTPGAVGPPNSNLDRKVSICTILMLSDS